jgi:hypothetical protein
MVHTEAIKVDGVNWKKSHFPVWGNKDAALTVGFFASPSRLHLFPQLEALLYRRLVTGGTLRLIL